VRLPFFTGFEKDVMIFLFMQIDEIHANNLHENISSITDCPILMVFTGFEKYSIKIFFLVFRT